MNWVIYGRMEKVVSTWTRWQPLVYGAEVFGHQLDWTNHLTGGQGVSFAHCKRAAGEDHFWARWQPVMG